MSDNPHDKLVYELNEEQWDDFMYHMTHPKPPTPAMIEASRRWHELVRSPGNVEYDSWQFPCTPQERST